MKPIRNPKSKIQSRDTHLEKIWMYPVKSARGIALREAEVGPRGLRGDRRWMIVDAEGRFLSQRSHPQLATIEARLDGETVSVGAAGAEFTVHPRHAREPLEVQIWKDTVSAKRVDGDVAAWLREQLGTPAFLVYMPEEARRPVEPGYAPNGHTVSFADAYPVLLIGTASLEDLNRRLEAPVSMRRFRPNLVIQTETPFVEDTWAEVRIGEVVLVPVKPCARCQVITRNPDTGAGGKEPLCTLATYRKQGSKVLFGQNAVVLQPGRIRVGDSVHVG